MGTDLKNINIYNQRMAKSLIDKIFFWDKIDVDYIVDFGCADGTLIKFLGKLDPNIKFIGYDNCEPMLKIAAKSIDEDKSVVADNYQFTSNWEAIKTIIKSGKKTCLILSSVLHEVIHYSSKAEIDKFWDDVYNSGFDYICLRDIIPSRTIDRPGSINDFLNIIKLGNKNKIADFERVWGSLENNKNLIHYLLKYGYDENWEREVKENYFAIYREEFLSLIGKNYEVTYHEHYILPFLREKIKTDFDITLNDNTHLKLILKKK
jgi:hypothetical protein